MYNYKKEKKNVIAVIERHRNFISDEIGLYKKINKQIYIAAAAGVNSSSIALAYRRHGIISTSLMEKIYEKLESSNLKKAKR